MRAEVRKTFQTTNDVVVEINPTQPTELVSGKYVGHVRGFALARLAEQGSTRGRSAPQTIEPPYHLIHIARRRFEKTTKDEFHRFSSANTRRLGSFTSYVRKKNLQVCGAILISQYFLGPTKLGGKLTYPLVMPPEEMLPFQRLVPVWLWLMAKEESAC